MSLLKLKDYLKNKRVASLFDLTTKFNLDPDIIRQMLKLLMNKGNLLEQKKTFKCGSQCAKCHPHQTELYIWVDI
jgi:hypothetical protein